MASKTMTKTKTQTSTKTLVMTAILAAAIGTAAAGGILAVSQKYPSNLPVAPVLSGAYLPGYVPGYIPGYVPGYGVPGYYPRYGTFTQLNAKQFEKAIAPYLRGSFFPLFR